MDKSVTVCRLNLAFLVAFIAFLTTPGGASTAAAPSALKQAVLTVPLWEMHEFTAEAQAHLENPFRDATLEGGFVSPSVKAHVVNGFYDGDDTWRLRFAPDEEGEWSYRLCGQGVQVLQRGKCRCTKARSHAFLRIHPQNPYAFAHADETPFFPMGDTCYGLTALFDCPWLPSPSELASRVTYKGYI